MDSSKQRHQIIVVGGGAGGFELVVQLGHRLGRKGLADVTLVDIGLSHIWKPLLHEVAAGTLNAHDDELNYLAYANWNHFRFRLGALEAIDRASQTVTLSPTLDEDGKEFIPRRSFPLPPTTKILVIQGSLDSLMRTVIVLDTSLVTYPASDVYSS